MKNLYLVSAFCALQLQEMRTSSAYRRASWHPDLALGCLFLLPASDSSAGQQCCPAAANLRRHPHGCSQSQVTGVGKGQTAGRTWQGLGCLGGELPRGPCPAAALLRVWGGLSLEGHGLGHGGSLQLSWTPEGLRAGGCLLTPLRGAGLWAAGPPLKGSDGGVPCFHNDIHHRGTWSLEHKAPVAWGSVGRLESH